MTPPGLVLAGLAVLGKRRYSLRSPHPGPGAGMPAVLASFGLVALLASRRRPDLLGILVCWGRLRDLHRVQVRKHRVHLVWADATGVVQDHRRGGILSDALHQERLFGFDAVREVLRHLE